MTGNAAFIAGDWGTTNARFWLCDGKGNVLAEARGPGVSTLRGSGRFAEEFAAATQGWPDELPAILCGTIGANIGWRQVGYRDLPANLDACGDRSLRFTNERREVVILAGVSGNNSFGVPDLMRGEDIQLCGVIASGGKDGLYVLPGTHNKWVIVEGGAITRFHTAMTGELYAAISGNTILLTDAAAPPAVCPAFDAGVKLALEHQSAGMAGLLFTVRTRQVLGKMPETEAASYLSGLMIGADVAGGLSLFKAEGAGEVTLVGGAGLVTSYARALELAGCKAIVFPGDDAVLIGLTQAWRQLFG